MRVRDLYTKAETEKQSMRLLSISIVVPSMLLVLVAVLSCYIASYTINLKIKEQLSVASHVVLSSPDVKIESVYEKCSVVYYDEKGIAIGDTKGFPSSYDGEWNNDNYLRIDGVRYSWQGGPTGKNNDGKVYYVVFIDITEENNLYRIVVSVSVVVLVAAVLILSLFSYWIVTLQMRHYEDALNRNNRLISDISHEFNTPLAVIKTSISTIMAEPEKKVEDVSEQLVNVTHESGRLSRMVRDMLILSRSDQDRLILEKKNCDVSAIVKDVVEPFELMCQLDDKKMNVSIDEGVLSRTDEDKVRQSIIILLDNAVKYTRPGDEIFVTLKNSSSKYSIIVADTGKGVPESELQNIFERFYRTDYSRSSETGGSGLGLSIVKTITGALKGKVVAEINEPHGLKIVLEFPKEKFT